LDRILSKKSAANLLGLDVRTVDRYVRRGALPFVHIGRHILFSFNRLAQWMTPVTPPASDMDLEPEERKKLENARRQEEVEERVRLSYREAERRLRMGERAEETLRLCRRMEELQGKDSLTFEEKEEQDDLYERLRVLSVEDEKEIEAEWQGFKSFFSGIEEPELKRVFDLLKGR